MTKTKERQNHIIIADAKVYRAADEYAQNYLDSNGTVEELLSKSMDKVTVKKVIKRIEKYNPSESYDDLYKWFLQDVNYILGQHVYDTH